MSDGLLKIVVPGQQILVCRYRDSLLCRRLKPCFISRINSKRPIGLAGGLKCRSAQVLSSETNRVEIGYLVLEFLVKEILKIVTGYNFLDFKKSLECR